MKRIYKLNNIVIIEDSGVVEMAIPTRCFRVEPEDAFVCLSDNELNRVINIPYSDVQNQAGAAVGAKAAVIAYLALFVSAEAGGTSSGGGGGDANATNQVTTNTNLGAVNETASTSDTAASGLNGRLQRIAQRLTSLIELFPSSIGLKNSAGSLSTVLASDDAQIGADNTTITQLNTGSGIRGWLSGIYKILTDTFTNSTSWFFKLTDGVNNATIKASGNVALLTDTALVVSESPSGILADVKASGVISAVASPTATLNLNGHGVAQFTITGIWVANLQIQFSGDGGATYTNITAANVIFNKATTVATNGTISANGTYILSVDAVTNFRIIATSFTSGAVNIQAVGSRASSLHYLTGNPVIGTNLSQINGSTINTNNGLSTAQTLRVVLANRTETQTGSIAASADIALPAGQRIKSLTFNNNTATPIFLQIFNKSTALALNDLPLNGLIFRVLANSTLDKTAADFGETGILYGATTRIGLSSSFGTYTAVTPLTNTAINVITVQ